MGLSDEEKAKRLYVGDLITFKVTSKGGTKTFSVLLAPKGVSILSGPKAPIRCDEEHTGMVVRKYRKSYSYVTSKVYYENFKDRVNLSSQVPNNYSPPDWCQDPRVVVNEPFIVYHILLADIVFRIDTRELSNYTSTSYWQVELKLLKRGSMGWKSKTDSE